jgi:hypothetical protein
VPWIGNIAGATEGEKIFRKVAILKGFGFPFPHARFYSSSLPVESVL